MEQLIKQNGEISLNWIAWNSFITLQGARFPSANDSFDYPVCTDLEIFRQGLLTYNTYISALKVSSEYIPSSSSLRPSATTSPRHFYQGQWVDALDTVNKWLEATVIAVSGDFVYIHDNGWPKVWDEWIHAVTVDPVDDM